MYIDKKIIEGLINASCNQSSIELHTVEIDIYAMQLTEYSKYCNLDSIIDDVFIDELENYEEALKCL